MLILGLGVMNAQSDQQAVPKEGYRGIRLVNDSSHTFKFQLPHDVEFDLVNGDPDTKVTVEPGSSKEIVTKEGRVIGKNRAFWLIIIEGVDNIDRLDPYYNRLSDMIGKHTINFKQSFTGSRRGSLNLVLDMSVDESNYLIVRVTDAGK